MVVRKQGTRSKTFIFKKPARKITTGSSTTFTTQPTGGGRGGGRGGAPPEERKQVFINGQKVSDTHRVLVRDQGTTKWVQASNVAGREVVSVPPPGTTEQQRQQIQRELTPAEKTIALEVAKQEVQFSEKARALLEQRQQEEARKVAEPTRAEVSFLGGRVKATGLVTPPPEARPKPTPKTPPESQEPEISLDVETARQVRQDLLTKPIQQTAIKIDLPDLRSFVPEEKRFSKIGAIEPVPRGGLLATDLDVTRYFAGKKIREADTFLEKWSKTLDVTIEVGKSFERTGKGLAGASLIFVGTTAKTAFQATPIGITESIITRGFVPTVEAYTFAIPRAGVALAKGELLQARTPLGKGAEALGIGTGIAIAGKVNRQFVRGGRKVSDAFRKEIHHLKEPGFKPKLRAKKVPEGEPVGTGQRKFIKVTETGRELPQFGEKFPEVTRVIAKRTGRIVRFDPIKSPIKGGAKVLRSKAEGQVRFDLPKQDIIKLEVDIPRGQKLILKQRHVIKPGKPTQPTPIGKQKRLPAGTIDKEFSTFLDVPISKFTAFKAGFKNVFVKMFKSKRGATPLTQFQEQITTSKQSLTPPKGLTPAPLGSLILVPPLVVDIPKQELGRGEGFEEDQIRKTRRDQIIPPTFRDIRITDTERIPKQDLISITKQIPKVIQIPDIDIDITREQKRDSDITIVPDIAIDLDLDLDKPRKQITKQPPVKAPPEKKLVIPGFFPPKRLKPKTPGRDLFFVKAKSKGKFMAINKTAIPRNKALNLGADVVDNTASATFKLIRSKKRGKIPDDFRFNKPHKFRKKNNTYIEKTTHRIDSRGEHLGITVKGWLAQRRLRGRF